MSITYNNNRDTIEEFLLGKETQGSNRTGGTLQFVRKGTRRILFYRNNLFAVYDTFDASDGIGTICITHDIRSKGGHAVASMIKSMMDKLPEGTRLLRLPLPKKLLYTAEADNIIIRIDECIKTYLDSILFMMKYPAQYPMHFQVEDIINKNIIDVLEDIKIYFDVKISRIPYYSQTVRSILGCLKTDTYKMFLEKACMMHNKVTSLFEHCNKFFDHCGNMLCGYFIANMSAIEDMHKPEAICALRNPKLPRKVAKQYVSSHHLNNLEHVSRFLYFMAENILTKLLSTTAKYLEDKDGIEAATFVAEEEAQHVQTIVSDQFKEIYYNKIGWDGMDFLFHRLEDVLKDSEAEIQEWNVGIRFKGLFPYGTDKDDVTRVLNFYAYHILPTMTGKDLHEAVKDVSWKK